jgi:hypothetical protein
MGASMIRISCVAQGRIIKPGDKIALTVRPLVLRVLAESLRSILSKMYVLSKGTIPGDSDTAGFPNGYYPQVTLTKDPRAEIIKYLGGKRVRLTNDEIAFIATYITPKCEQEIHGDVSENDIRIYPQMKLELLAGVSRGIAAVLQSYLPKS